VNKNIVFCADGTWNHPGETEDGQPADTNVYKFFKALVTDATQLPFYDDGVGADGTPVERLLGGAIGDGLFDKIKAGYAKIAHNYQPGDRVFIFGFSRGAYTARSLAGMIAVCGLPDPDKFTNQSIDDAFAAYRAGPNRQPLLDALARNYGNSIGGPGNANVEIAMVGVWDTVGALGIPGGMFAGLDDQIYGFLDTALHPDIKAACHAVSINERRAEFGVTLWDRAVAPDQDLAQLWFAGNHGDVGGGWAETGLSDLTLGWMMAKAQAKGVTFDPDVFAHYASIDPIHALDPIHDAWSVVWGLPKLRTIAADSTISPTVMFRLNNDPSYRPANLPPGLMT
jgi:uncharacterized protein (DUF2235 family)